MRTFIQVRASTSGAKVSSHARYISERERDPSREEPSSRPIFTHNTDGLKYKGADRYLAGGEKPKARSNEILHLIIAFNSYDQKELQKLEIKRCSNFEHSQNDENPDASNEKAQAARLQVERDLPYANAVRMMFKEVEEQTELSDLRYAMAVHRHTTQTHVHLLLRREYTDKATGEKRNLGGRLPEQFLNGRDEEGKARGGLLDNALSKALDTMIPKRQRPGIHEHQGRSTEVNLESMPDKGGHISSPPESTHQHEKGRDQNLGIHDKRHNDPEAHDPHRPLQFKRTVRREPLPTRENHLQHTQREVTASIATQVPVGSHSSPVSPANKQTENAQREGVPPLATTPARDSIAQNLGTNAHGLAHFLSIQVAGKANQPSPSDAREKNLSAPTPAGTEKEKILQTPLTPTKGLITKPPQRPIPANDKQRSSQSRGR